MNATNQQKSRGSVRETATNRDARGNGDATHPVSLNQSIPPSHEPLPHDILELCLRVSLLVEGVGDSLVAVLEERAKTRSDELVEELVGSGLGNEKVRRQSTVSRVTKTTWTAEGRWASTRTFRIVLHFPASDSRDLMASLAASTSSSRKD